MGAAVERFPDRRHHHFGVSYDLRICELEGHEASQYQSVRPLSVDRHLSAGSMPAIAEGLDDDRRSREVEVNSDQLVAAPAEHNLRRWLWQPGVVEYP